MSKQIPVVIDTDTGVDDALALIIALKSPELLIHAVTTVAGNVEVEKCTRNVLAVLDRIGYAMPVVVAQGAGKPLRRELVTARDVHGRDGLGDRSLSRRVSKRRHAAHAVEVLLEACERYGRELAIIALGPLTNVALAWKRNPRALRNVRSIVTMGGAFRVAGNTGPVAEFNYYVDPEAARIVLRSGLPVVVVPLDVTEQVVLFRSELTGRASSVDRALLDFVSDATAHYMEYHSRSEGFDGCYLHDPIAVAAVIDPSMVTTREVLVDVETQGTLTRGMIAYPREQRSGRKTHPHVAHRIDRERFLSLFHERLWR